jgi:TatA/E family protein of Tat protein translocase
MNLGMPEMIFIFLLALILFGPKKLPEIGREIGKFLAEFKRASNDFTSQIQSEIEKAGVDTGSLTQMGAQQSSNFAQTLLPPAVTSAITEIDSAHERLMKTAKMAFEAQNFTLRAPEAPVVASQAAEQSAAAAESPEPSTGENSTPAAEASAMIASQVSPVEAATGQPTPNAAPVQSNSASQSS